MLRKRIKHIPNCPRIKKNSPFLVPQAEIRWTKRAVHSWRNDGIEPASRSDGIRELLDLPDG
jgi:hypothetical protein